ncbi:MAG: glutamine synthetase type III, partial [Bacteroidales bacterium]
NNYVAAPVMAINTAIGNQLKNFKNEVEKLIEKEDLKKDEAIFRVLKVYIQESRNIRFEGDGYCKDWVQEAKKRGLSNISTIPGANEMLMSSSATELFSKNNILNPRELKARKEIRLEQYVKKTQIEARVLGDLSMNHIIPTALKYQNILLENIQKIKEIYPDNQYKKMTMHQMNTVERIATHITNIREKVVNMINERKKANQISDIKIQADTYNKKVCSYFEDIRYHVDKLEMIIDDEIWPFPKYREMLFTR